MAEEKSYDELFDEIIEEKSSDEKEIEDEEKNAGKVQEETDNESQVESEFAETQEEIQQEDEINSEKSENFSGNDTSKAEDNSEVAELKRIIAALEEQNRQLAHSVKSNTGRVSALQKKNNALQERIEELTKSKGSETPLEDSEDAVQQLLEEYPNLAKGMMQLAKQQLQQELEPFRQKVEEKLELSEDAAHQAAVEKQIQELDAALPNWREVAGDEFFQNWLAVQPEKVQLMAAGTDAQEVIAVFNLYSQHLASLGFGQEQPQQEEQQEPVKEQPQQQQPTRRRKVADVAPHAGGVVSSSANSGVLDDYDALWESVVAQRTRNRR